MVKGEVNFAMETFSQSGESLDTFAKDEYRKGHGCWVSATLGLIFILLAILLALGVGTVVFFFAPTYSTLQENGVETTTQAAGGVETTTQAAGGVQTTAGSVQTTAGYVPTLAPDATYYRLPTDLYPTYYRVLLRPDIYTDDPLNFTFTGEVKIKLSCRKETNRIVLHARDLDIQRENVQVLTAEDRLISSTPPTRDDEKEWEIIELENEALVPGNNYTVVMSFSGAITSDMRGLYWSRFQVDTRTRYVMSSQLQSTDARKVFPCLDEPSYKAVYSIVMDRRPDYESYANMPVESTEELSDGWTRDHFEETPKMSVYLLAFMVVADWACAKSTTSKGQEVEICGRSTAEDQLDLANNVSAPLQEWFEWYHNVSYPLKKTVHAAVPDFSAGAMENWGLIIYRDYNLLFNPTSSTASQKQRIVVVIAHELAHQWFGNLVSMDWWSDVWLNEGFASYMETLATAQLYPEWRMEDDTVVGKVQSVMRQDGLASSHPVFQAADSPAEVASLFDGITYSKGASVIRMMHFFLGEDIFRWGLSNYLKDRAYDTATHEDLFHFLTKEAESRNLSVDVNAVMKPWILQLGYPVVTFSMDNVAGKVTVSQKHFLLDPASEKDLPSSPYGYSWPVPVSYATSSMTDLSTWDDSGLYKQWLNASSAELECGERCKDAEWIVGNVKQRFYYRTNYEESNWKALIQTINTDHEKIEVKNRAQLVDDSFNLGRSGSESFGMSRFLDVASYMSKEESFLPWWSFERGVNYLQRVMEQTVEYGKLQRFMHKMYKDQYTRLGWTSSDNHIEQRMRSLVLNGACSFKLPECVEEGKRHFQEWMSSTENTISPDLRYLVYCTGVEVGGEDEWDFLWSKRNTANSGAETRAILNSLGCTQQHWLLIRYLDMAVAEREIRRQDFITVFSAVSSTALGRNLAWEFLVNNWAVIFDRFGETMSFHSIISAATSGFVTQYRLKLVRAFQEKAGDLGSGEFAFTQAIETIQSNIDFLEANLQEISGWLSTHLEL